MVKKEVVIDLITTKYTYSNAIVIIPKESRLVDHLNNNEKQFFVIRSRVGGIHLISKTQVLDIEIVKEED